MAKKPAPAPVTEAPVEAPVEAVVEESIPESTRLEMEAGAALVAQARAAQEPAQE